MVRWERSVLRAEHGQALIAAALTGRAPRDFMPFSGHIVDRDEEATKDERAYAQAMAMDRKLRAMGV